MAKAGLGVALPGHRIGRLAFVPGGEAALLVVLKLKDEEAHQAAAWPV